MSPLCPPPLGTPASSLISTNIPSIKYYKSNIVLSAGTVIHFPYGAHSLSRRSYHDLASMMSNIEGISITEVDRDSLSTEQLMPGLSHDNSTDSDGTFVTQAEELRFMPKPKSEIIKDSLEAGTTHDELYNDPSTKRMCSSESQEPKDALSKEVHASMELSRPPSGWQLNNLWPGPQDRPLQILQPKKIMLELAKYASERREREDWQKVHFYHWLRVLTRLCRKANDAARTESKYMLEEMLWLTGLIVTDQTSVLTWPRHATGPWTCEQVLCTSIR